MEIYQTCCNIYLRSFDLSRKCSKINLSGYLLRRTAADIDSESAAPISHIRQYGYKVCCELAYVLSLVSVSPQKFDACVKMSSVGIGHIYLSIQCKVL